MSTPLRTPTPSPSNSSEQPRGNPDVRLSVEQASYAYAPNPSQAPLFTLEALSFQAKPGEIVSILGPNASGKSTLLKLISGRLSPFPAVFSSTDLSPILFRQSFVPSGLPLFSKKAACFFLRAFGNLFCRDATRTGADFVLCPKRTWPSPATPSPRWAHLISRTAGWTKSPEAKNNV